MSATIALIIGLCLGISYSFWKIRQYQLQLEPIKASISENLRDLPLIERVSQSFILANKQSQQLERQLQIWQDSIELAPIGYLLLDEENQLLWCNYFARNLLKIDRWEKGKIRLLLELVRSYQLDRLIEETRQTQKSLIKEWLFYPNYDLAETNTVARESIAIKGSSFPLKDGRVAVFLENQQSLVELSRSKERTFSDLTHELRTPITAIGLVAETIREKLQNPERKWVERAISQVDRLKNLIHDWLELTKIGENPLAHLNYSTIAIPELIFSVWEHIEPLAAAKTITLVYEGPDILSLQADRDRLTQVLLNLFDNAIAYSPPESKITIKAALVEAEFHQQIEIATIDSGSGFEPTDLPYIFDRLYRGDHSRTRQISGTNSNGKLNPVVTSGSGLGLAIAREIIQAHQGEIIACNHPDTGSGMVKFTIPTDKPDRQNIIQEINE